MAKNFTIEKSHTIKLLGFYIQSDLKLNKEIGTLTSQLHSRLFNLNMIRGYTDFKTRLNFCNSFVIGKLIYMLPLYSHAPQILIDKLHRVLMKAARYSIGNYCYRLSCNYILGKCNWLSIGNMIIQSGINFTYKTLCNREPE